MITDSLMSMVNHATELGNKAEARVSVEIIFISSAVLAIVGVISDSSSLRLTKFDGVFLAIASLGLGLSLLAGVAHFWSERRFWYSIREKGQLVTDILDKMPEDAKEKDAAAKYAYNQLATGSNILAYRIQLSAFSIGMVALTVVIVARILSSIR